MEICPHELIIPTYLVCVFLEFTFSDFKFGGYINLFDLTQEINREPVCIALETDDIKLNLMLLLDSIQESPNNEIIYKVIVKKALVDISKGIYEDLILKQVISSHTYIYRRWNNK